MKNKKKYLFRMCKGDLGPNKLYVYEIPEEVDIMKAPMQLYENTTREPIEVYNISGNKDYMFSNPDSYLKIKPVPYYFRNTQIIYAQLSCQFLDFTADIEFPVETKKA